VTPSANLFYPAGVLMAQPGEGQVARADFGPGRCVPIRCRSEWATRPAARRQFFTKHLPRLAGLRPPAPRAPRPPPCHFCKLIRPSTLTPPWVEKQFDPSVVERRFIRQVSKTFGQGQQRRCLGGTTQPLDNHRQFGRQEGKLISKVGRQGDDTEAHGLGRLACSGTSQT